MKNANITKEKRDEMIAAIIADVESDGESKVIVSSIEIKTHTEGDQTWSWATFQVNKGGVIKHAGRNFD